MKTVFERLDGAFPVILDQHSFSTRGKQFRLTYGVSVKSNLDYAEACKELGEALLHCLTCEGVIDGG
jgi:hypothetical protein